MNEEGAKCQYQFKFENTLIAIQYDNQTKTLACMDNECQIGVFRKNFIGTEEPEVVAEPVQKAAEVTLEEDDIDLEDINMEDFEDNDENADKVEIPDAPKEEIKVLDLVPEQQEVAAVEENVEIAVEAPKAAEVEAVAS